MAELRQDLEQRLSAFNTLLKADVAPYNKAAYSAGAPTVFGGEAVNIEAPPRLNANE